MDKAIGELFKVFSHLAREIQAYVFGGLIVFADIRLIDNFYYNDAIWKFIAFSDYTLLVVIIVAYIIGNICLALYVPIEIIGIDKFFRRLCFAKYMEEHCRIRTLTSIKIE